MLSQSDMERELYEGRLKARRDLQTRETELRIAQEELDEARRDMQTMESERRIAKEKVEQFGRQLEEADRRASESNRQRDEARQQAQESLAKQIQLAEHVLGRPLSSFEELIRREPEDLRRTADRQERELLECPLSNRSKSASFSTGTREPL